MKRNSMITRRGGRFAAVVLAILSMQSVAHSAEIPPISVSPLELAPPKPRVICDRVIDDFSRSKLGHFPLGWGTREAEDRPLVETQGAYAVRDFNGLRVLHARYRDKAITIGRPVKNWNLDEYPILQWKWRALKLPTRGNEKQSARNDSAAGVYAIWKVGFPFHIDGIKYSWSTTLPPGTRHSKRMGHDQLLVVESGPSSSDGLSSVRVNVREHHREFFERTTPRSPNGIALLTDADATDSSAEAFYADFRLCRFSG